MNINFGPSGLGPVKEAILNLEKYSKLGLTACEIAFTYSAYIKEDDAIEIGKAAKKFKIKLSIHAPYFINLNSKEKEKIESSKSRILKSCRIGHLLGAEQIVFHAGFYSGMDKEEAYQNIKKGIIELQERIKEEKYNVKLSPEVMGKINVFGSIEEISRLSKETTCSFTIDFAHILARYKENRFQEVINSFPQPEWHCHFSGIEYGEKGEKKHINTPESEYKELLTNISKLDKTITIINESPQPVEDSLLGLKLYKK